TALAGTGHVLCTALLGVLIAWFGIALHEKIGQWFPWIAGGALLCFGLFYLYRQLSGAGCGHSHLFGGHSHPESVPHLHVHEHAALRPGPHGGALIEWPSPAFWRCSPSRPVRAFCRSTSRAFATGGWVSLCLRRSYRLGRSWAWTPSRGSL